MVTHVPRNKRVVPPPSDTIRKQRRVLILELNGVLLHTIEIQHGDVSPDWAEHMHLVEENTSVWHLIRKDAFTFLDFAWNGLRYGFGVQIDYKGLDVFLSCAFHSTIKSLRL